MHSALRLSLSVDRSVTTEPALIHAHAQRREAAGIAAAAPLMYAASLPLIKAFSHEFEVTFPAGVGDSPTHRGRRT